MRSFVPFLIAFFVLAALLRIDFFFTIAYLFFTAYILARLLTSQARQHVQTQRRFLPCAFFGDQVKVEVSVRNTGWLPVPWLELRESLAIELATPPLQQHVLSLGPRGERRFLYKLNCNKRGYYPIGPLAARTGDLLGLETRYLPEIQPEYITVYPHIVPLAQLGLPTRSPLVALPARAPLFEDPARVRGVRNYQIGDSPRRIHWTASARAGRLLVKQYQPAISRATLICLNLNAADYTLRQRYTAVELGIVAAASLAHHIIIHDHLAAGLSAEGLDSRTDQCRRVFLPPRPERAHLINILAALACAQVTATAPFPEQLRHASAHLAWGDTLVVITGREDENLLETLVQLRHTGFAVALVLVQPTPTAAALQARADLLHLPVHRVWRERDLEAWA